MSDVYGDEGTDTSGRASYGPESDPLGKGHEHASTSEDMDRGNPRPGMGEMH